MAAPANLEDDFRIVRRSYPDVARSARSVTSSISTPKPSNQQTQQTTENNIGGSVRAGEWPEVLARLERLESQQLQNITAEAERREECLSLASQVAELRSALSAQESSLRSSLNGDIFGRSEEQKSLQSALTTIQAFQAQSEQTRLQISELQKEQAALRERQVAREGEFGSKIVELISCVDDLARQVQELKQDSLTETTLMRSRLEANSGDHDAHLTRLENLEVQQKEEQGRLNTESAALKARLQALELRLAAASLEKISAQAASANKAQEQFDVRMARLEASLLEASKGVPSIQGTTTAPSNRSASASVSVASMEDAGGLAHLVGEMDAELRVEINSRLRLLSADLKGEIMSEVASRLASAEASVSSIEAKLSHELTHVCEDFKVCLESITKARLVPRLKLLEDQMKSTKLLVATMEAHARTSWPQSPQASQDLKEKDHINTTRRHSIEHLERQQEPKEEDPAAKMFISNGLRQRLHGLVSALSWTLGQVQEAETQGEGEGGKAANATRRASDGSVNPNLQRRVSASGGAIGACRPVIGEAPDLPQEFAKPKRQGPSAASPPVTSPAPGAAYRSPGNRTMTPQPASGSMQVPAAAQPCGIHWHPGGPVAPVRPINSMPASRGASPPLAQRNSLQRHAMSATASPFQPPGHRSPQLVFSQRPGAPAAPAAPVQYRR